MLVSLHVKNLALIDETEVFFQQGLNILTGETGAGKSIILGSINLALGDRADKNMIRSGHEYALIELVFEADTKEQRDYIAGLDIPLEEDGQVIIQRKIMTGRSVCKINGEAASAKTLKDLASVFIDIHGQNEHQSLLHKKKHLELLDDYAGEELSAVKHKIATVFSQYRDAKRELEEMTLDEETRKRELSLAEFEVKEIRELHLKPGEDELLESLFHKMRNSQKIMEASSLAYENTGSESGASAFLSRAIREIRNVSQYDETIFQMLEQLLQVDSLLNDFNRDISEYIAGTEYDEIDFVQTEERLNQLNHMKSKYGNTVEEILLYCEKREAYIDKMLHLDQLKSEIENRLTKLLASLKDVSKKAGAIRVKAAKQLEKEMTEALGELNFNNTKFEISVFQKEGFYSADGIDDVEFLIAANPGEPLKPIGAVASGGELSRIMLALKTRIAKRDDIQTLIFDEIDAGISGKTAWKVAEQLGKLGISHQVICITHLPQIAAMADTHFVIEKITDLQTTQTLIREMLEEESIQELARLLGGIELTATVIENAKEMKELARKTKQY